MGCFVYSPKAQILEKATEESEVPIIQNIGSRYFRCYFDNGIYDQPSFQKLISTKDCEYASAFLKPDFKT